MNTPVLSSTFLLTLLLLVGLFFFIRASVKDRTQIVRLVSDLTTESFALQLQRYFVERAYQVTEVNGFGQAIAFQGIVRPSFFLAIFLTVLAGIGIGCLFLVLSTLYSDLPKFSYLLVILSPLAGFFYWRRAKRPENVLLKFDSGNQLSDRESSNSNLTGNDLVNDAVKPPLQSIVTIQAHRDELLELQRTLPVALSDQ